MPHKTDGSIACFCRQFCTKASNALSTSRPFLLPPIIRVAGPEVYYRWHALHGRKVRQLYAERRSGRDVAIIEAQPGIAIVITAWMLDPAICAAMSLGSPMVDIIGLTDLDRLLRALGLRRACFAEPPSTEEVHHANTDASGRPRQAATSTRHSIGDRPMLNGMTVDDRSTAVRRLARLLMEAVSMAPEEIGDDER
jgi:hypothetical protein